MNPASPLGVAQLNALGACVRSRKVGRGKLSEPVQVSSLWSTEDTEAVCRFVHLPDGDTLRLHCRGARVHERLYRKADGLIVYSALERLMATGASLNLAGVEDYSNTILAMTRELESHLGCAVQANLYETPGHGRGLGPHADPHDVLVLQLRGRKRWTLDTPIHISRGDWLFLPKLVAHDVCNDTDETSVHLTLGLHPVTPDGEWSHGDATRRTRVRNYQVAVPAGDRMPSGPADTSRFQWRSDARIERRTATTVSVDLPYRRSPLTLRERAADALEQLALMGTFGVADVPLDASREARLLCRLLAGVGCLSAA